MTPIIDVTLRRAKFNSSPLSDMMGHYAGEVVETCVRAYILVNIRAGMVLPVIEQLSRIEEVREVYSITGNYDALIHAQVNDVKDVHQRMIDRIHRIDGVTDTATYIVLQ